MKAVEENKATQFSEFTKWWENHEHIQLSGFVRQEEVILPHVIYRKLYNLR